MKILFLTEFGSGIGLGHVTRIKAISDYFESNLDICNVIKYEFGNENTNWFSNFELLKNLKDYNAIIIDSYLCPEFIYTKIYNENSNLIVLDDYNRISYSASVIVNPNVYFKENDYLNQKSLVVGGKDYVILRKKFRENSFIHDKKFSPGRILVTLGGSDYRNLFSKLLPLSLYFPNVRFIIPEKETYNKLKIKYPTSNLLGQLDENNFWKELSNAEIVISACGQTLHECASMNKTTIGICIDIDQLKNKEFYSRENFLFSAYDWDEYELFSKLVKNCKSLLNSKKKFIPVSKIFHPEQNMNNYRNLVKSLIQ